MAKRKKHAKTQKHGALAVPIVIVAVLAIVLACMIGYVVSGGDTQPEQTAPPAVPTDASAVPEADTAPGTAQETTLPPETTAPSEATEPDDRLPYLLEDGKLEIESLFQYTGLNPDCYWQDGSNVGAVVLSNRSEEYLESLDMTVTMTDGTQLRFLIADIPAGKTVWAYDTNNTSFDSTSVIKDVQYEAVFVENTGLLPEQIDASVEGISVTLTNLTDGELTGLEMRCHSVLEGVYFGGTSYSYPVESIAAGGSVTVVAEDCFFGETEVTIVDYAK